MRSLLQSNFDKFEKYLAWPDRKIIYFQGLDDYEEDEDDEIKANGAPAGDDSIMQQLMGGRGKFKKPLVNMMVDLAFASNVRFLDDHELYLDNVELYRVSNSLLKVQEKDRDNGSQGQDRDSAGTRLRQEYDGWPDFCQ